MIASVDAEGDHTLSIPFIYISVQMYDIFEALCARSN